MGGPIANLNTRPESAGAQLGAVLAEPFPIAFRHIADSLPLGLEAAVAVEFCEGGHWGIAAYAAPFRSSARAAASGSAEMTER
jgi:hypothetical protein